LYGCAPDVQPGGPRAISPAGARNAHGSGHRPGADLRTNARRRRVLPLRRRADRV